MAVLVSTPYMDEAERCARVGLVCEGRLLLEGQPRQMLVEFDEETYEVVGGDREALDALLSSRAEVKAMSPAGSRLRIEVERGHGAEVKAALAPLGVELRRVSSDFESLFLSRMRRSAEA
jgi:ABC-2 type transport system ATP-binding protein